MCRLSHPLFIALVTLASFGFSGMLNDQAFANDEVRAQPGGRQMAIGVSSTFAGVGLRAHAEEIAKSVSRAREVDDLTASMTRVLKDRRHSLNEKRIVLRALKKARGLEERLPKAKGETLSQSASHLERSFVMMKRAGTGLIVVGLGNAVAGVVERFDIELDFSLPGTPSCAETLGSLVASFP